MQKDNIQKRGASAAPRFCFCSIFITVEFVFYFLRISYFRSGSLMKLIRMMATTVPTMKIQ